MSVTGGIARIVCYVLGFLFVLAGLGALFISASVGVGLFVFGLVFIAIGKVLRSPEVGTPLTQVNVYQQAAPPMMMYAPPPAPYAPPAPVQQTYVHERETVKVRCRNCGSLNLETQNFCQSCGAPM